MKRRNDWKDFKKVIEEQGIQVLFHFTDQENIRPIRERGGLYSWAYLDAHDMEIPRPGGNDLSRSLDLRDGYQDYVRLSFNSNPPMLIVAKRNGSIPHPVIIRVDPKVMYWERTIFADMNATDNEATTGNDLAAFRAIRFPVAMANTWKGEDEKAWRQAEVMVPTHIPIEFLSIPA